MRFSITLFVLLFSTIQIVEAQVTLSQARSNYLGMDKDECKALELSKKFEKSPPSDALLKAYFGASLAAAPACIGSPMEKLKYFRRGKQLLDESVKQQSTNVEIRFLRFATQTKAPSFLGYTSNIDEDKIFILKNIGSYAKSADNADMSKQIAKFLIASGELSSSEKAGLTAIVK